MGWTVLFLRNVWNTLPSSVSTQEARTMHQCAPQNRNESKIPLGSKWEVTKDIDTQREKKWEVTKHIDTQKENNKHVRSEGQRPKYCQFSLRIMGRLWSKITTHTLCSHKSTNIQTQLIALLQLASWPLCHLWPAGVTTYLHSEEVVHSRDDDVDSCIVASLSSQVILKIYIRPIF